VAVPEGALPKCRRKSVVCFSYPLKSLMVWGRHRDQVADAMIKALSKVDSSLKKHLPLTVQTVRLAVG